MAQAASPRELLTAQSDAFSPSPAAGALPDTPGGPDLPSPLGHDDRPTLGSPPPPADQHLDGTRGRSQAFDLAARQPPAAADPKAPPSPLLAASAPQLAAAGGSPAAAPATSPTAVASDMSGSAAKPRPARIDSEHRFRRSIPLLVFAAAASELASRWVGPGEEGTNLDPPKLPRAKAKHDSAT